ncbi:hypothetical protein ABH935_006700 [Catenulispora sp. GAS73]|uniref:hypothetical protein n=1 Tax=Catenulispora sp. GAS73 TaxID=3156269 RepID=UPI0035197F20
MSPQDSLPKRSPDTERHRVRTSRRATHHLLRLYPAGYRDLHGEEIMSLHCDARLAADGRLARLREDLDLAAHAVRTRLRITSAYSPGRALGSAAAWLVAGAGASAAYALLEPKVYGSTRLSIPPVAMALNLLLLLGLGLAAAGLWRWATPLTVLAGTVLAVTLEFTGPSPHWFNPRADFLAVTAVLLLCAPPDLRPNSAGARGTMLATAVAMALPLGAWRLNMDVSLPGYGPSDYGPWPVVVMAVVSLIALIRVREQPAVFAGAVVAVLPWFCHTVVIPVLAGEALAFAAMTLIGVILSRADRKQLVAAPER